MSAGGDTTAAALIIGAEVLSGKVDDQNGPFLIRSLRERGVRLVEIRILDDHVPTIAAAVRELAARVDHLFTTGGIGPTHDDVTIGAIAEALGVPVVHHPELVARVAQRYGEGNEGPHMRLAEVPQGAEVRLTPDAVVPAVRAGNIVILPGVPSLMRIAFSNIAADLTGATFFSKGLLLDCSESAIAPGLADVQHAHADVSIGSYPRFDDAHYRVKVTVDGRDEAAFDATMADLRAALGADCIVGEV